MKIIPKASSLAYCFDKLTSEVISMNSITPGWIEVRSLTARLDIVTSAGIAEASIDTLIMRHEGIKA